MEPSLPEGLVQHMRKRVRESLTKWRGSESDKDTATSHVLSGLAKGLPLDADPGGGEAEVVGAHRKKVRNREFSERATSISQLLKGKKEGDVGELLAPGKLDLQELFQSSVAYVKKNREVFSTITHRHQQLSIQNKQGTAWEEAVNADESSLLDYAQAATAMGEKQWVRLGNNWMETTAIDFFCRGGAVKHFVKAKRAEHFAQNRSLMTSEQSLALSCSMQENLLAETTPSVQGRPTLKVLDVGSCYNPLSANQDFDVTAIDLCPSHPSVYTCDFLALEVGPRDSEPVFHALDSSSAASVSAAANHGDCASFRAHQLPLESFDVVTMSLVLSYLPSQRHRRQMVEKARALLKSQSQEHKHRSGILLIVEKESVLHPGQGKKEDLLKQWKLAIQELGFELHRYTLLNSDKKKAHAFCFVKCENATTGGSAATLRIKGEPVESV